MAITDDGSGPVEIKLLNSTAATATTASFSPRAASLVRVAVSFGYDGNTTTGPTVTVADSASVSYTAGPSGYDGGATGAYLFQHYYATAPGSITVTVTRSGQLGAASFYVSTQVLDGAASNQSGAASSGTHAQTGTTIAGTITPTTLGSWIAVVGAEGSTQAMTASGLTQDTQWNNSSDGVSVATGHVASVASLSAQSPGWTVAAAPFWSWAAWEILPAASASPLVLPQRGGKAYRRRYRLVQFPVSPPPLVLNVNAGLATGTGIAPNAPAFIQQTSNVAQVPTFIDESPIAQANPLLAFAPWPPVEFQPPGALTPILATGTGTAQAPGIELTPVLAAGTGAAQSPSPSFTSAAGLAAATGTAQGPGTELTGALAAANGTAQGAGIGDQGGSVTSTGAASGPGIDLTPALATGTGTAQGPGIGDQGGSVTSTGAASGPGLELTPALATATGAAPAPGTGEAGGSVTSTGAASGPGIELTAGLATGTGAAGAPSSGLSAGTAAGAAAAQAPGFADTGGAVTGTGAASGPGLELTPALATAAGAAQGPAVSLGYTAGLPAGAGTASAPGAGNRAGTGNGTGAAGSTGSQLTPVFAVAAASSLSLQSVTAAGAQLASALGTAFSAVAQLQAAVVKGGSTGTFVGEAAGMSASVSEAAGTSGAVTQPGSSIPGGVS